MAVGDDIGYGHTAGFLWQQLLLYRLCIRDIKMCGEFKGDLGEPQGRLKDKTPRSNVINFPNFAKPQMILESGD
jgi:hypothetical protein